MPEMTLDTTVGTLVTDDARRAKIFEELGIDYCCGGGQSLEAACRKHDLHAETVLQMLKAIPKSEKMPAENTDWTNRSLGALIDHIESTHHAYLRRELSRLENLLETVVHVHGDRAPWMRSAQTLFNDLKPELLDHLEQEEEVTFPMVRALENEEAGSGPSNRREVLIELREAEHDEAGEALGELRELTDGFTPPEWACNTFRAALETLAELEKDMHEHMHKENNILFKRARTLI